jgi:DNA-directed RNA polymerase subunit RPC12/RpoP
MDVYEDVECRQCGFKGTVKERANTCPKCGEVGTLQYPEADLTLDDIIPLFRNITVTGVGIDDRKKELLLHFENNITVRVKRKQITNCDYHLRVINYLRKEKNGR